MTAGERLQCPRCHEETIVQSRKKMEMFRCVGEELICPLCGAVLGTPEAAQNKAPDPAAAASAKLAALLGETAGAKPAWKAEGPSGFCRSCVHFVANPFRTVCILDNRDVDPMNHCERFEEHLQSGSK